MARLTFTIIVVWAYLGHVMRVVYRACVKYVPTMRLNKSEFSLCALFSVRRANFGHSFHCFTTVSAFVQLLIFTRRKT